MTNEEAIHNLYALKLRTKILSDKKALEMAIKALEQQPNRCDSCTHSEEQDGSNCYECIKGMADNFEAQPTDADCISRKAVFQIFDDACYIDSDWYVMREKIKKLPSVTLTRPKGKWIILDECANEGVYCSKCHKKIFKLEFSNTMKWRNFKYCPNCGAKMEAENEKETC